MTADPTSQTGVPTCYRHPDRETYIRCQRCGRPICPDCMRDAAVGFQCPSCVAEGAKSTRSGRTAYGGLRPTKASTTSMVLIGVNVVVFLMALASGGTAGKLVAYLGQHTLGRCELPDGRYFPGVTQAVCEGAGPSSAYFAPGVADGALWQLLSNGFLHASILHIGLNMLALYALGPQLEVALGRTRFLALYVVSLLAGSTLVLWAADENTLTLGASGAIFGLLGATLVIAYKVGGNVQQILLWVGLNALITFTVPYISWQGHLGGFLGGAAVAAVLVYSPRGPRRSVVQAAGLASVVAVLAAAVVLRLLTV